jgi:anti-anti-sigma factor
VTASSTQSHAFSDTGDPPEIITATDPHSTVTLRRSTRATGRLSPISVPVEQAAPRLLEGVTATPAVIKGVGMNTTDTAGPPSRTVSERVGKPAVDITASNGRLRITSSLDPRRLRIEGDLDRATVHALTEALASMADDSSLVVDLSGLVFIDVGGLRALSMAAARLEGDHVLTLGSASPHVRRLLDLTGWHDTPHLRLGGP